jgi:hypothetical protein
VVVVVVVVVVAVPYSSLRFMRQTDSMQYLNEDGAVFNRHSPHPPLSKNKTKPIHISLTRCYSSFLYVTDPDNMSAGWRLPPRFCTSPLHFASTPRRTRTRIQLIPLNQQFHPSAVTCRAPMPQQLQMQSPT